MQHPEKVGYRAHNDVWAAFKARFINSFNTASAAADLPSLFLDDYNTWFPETPVFIGEYHNPWAVDLRRDLEIALDLALDDSTMLQGISFFEYQVRQDLNSTET